MFRDYLQQTGHRMWLILSRKPDRPQQFKLEPSELYAATLAARVCARLSPVGKCRTIGTVQSANVQVGTREDKLGCSLAIKLGELTQAEPQG